MIIVDRIRIQVYSTIFTLSPGTPLLLTILVLKFEDVYFTIRWCVLKILLYVWQTFCSVWSGSTVCLCLSVQILSFYSIYPKYWDTITIYHIYLKIWTSPFFYLPTSKNCWMSGKQYRPWSDAADSVYSEPTLFTQGRSQYLVLLRYLKIDLFKF